MVESACINYVHAETISFQTYDKFVAFVGYYMYLEASNQNAGDNAQLKLVPYLQGSTCKDQALSSVCHFTTTCTGLPSER